MEFPNNEKSVKIMDFLVKNDLLTKPIEKYLEHACRTNNVFLAKYLSKYGCNNMILDIDKLFFSICCHGYNNIAKILIKLGANIETKNRDGDTVLIYGCHYGYINLVKTLLKNNANINVKGCHNETAFHVACKYGNKKLVKLLLKHNVNIMEEKNWLGKTGQEIAKECGKLEIVDLIKKIKRDLLIRIFKKYIIKDLIILTIGYIELLVI